MKSDSIDFHVLPLLRALRDYCMGAHPVSHSGGVVNCVLRQLAGWEATVSRLWCQCRHCEQRKTTRALCGRVRTSLTLFSLRRCSLCTSTNSTHGTAALHAWLCSFGAFWTAVCVEASLD